MTTPSDPRAKIKGLESSLARLRLENQALRKAIVGQTAQLTLIVALLVQKGQFTKEDAVLVATAAVDAQSYSGLTPERIREWMLDKIAQSGPQTPTTSSSPPESPPGTVRPTGA